MKPSVVYEDDQGSMIDYPDDDYLEVRWYDASCDFTTQTYNQRPEVIASVVEHCDRSGMLVDTMQFRMSPEDMDFEWRDANVIPRFNAAGVKKLALLVPAAMPTAGAPPRHKGQPAFQQASSPHEAKLEHGSHRDNPPWPDPYAQHEDVEHHMKKTLDRRQPKVPIQITREEIR